MVQSKRVLVAAAVAAAMSLAGISGAHAVAAKTKGAVQKTHMHMHGHKHAASHKHGHKHMSMHKHGHKHGHKHMSMHGYAAKPAPAAKPAAKAVAKAKGPGSCGTYMYWKAGKCNDARAKKA